MPLVFYRLRNPQCTHTNAFPVAHDGVYDRFYLCHGGCVVVRDRQEQVLPTNAHDTKYQIWRGAAFDKRISHIRISQKR